MRRLGLLAVGVLLLSSAAAFAEDTSKGEVSAGWRYYHAAIHGIAYYPASFTNIEPNDFPKGWYADVSGNLSPKFAVVGEAGGTYYKTDSTSTGGSVTVSDSSQIRLHTFMGGVRVRAPQNARLIPFGQVLFGGERSTSSYNHTTTIRFSNGVTTPLVSNGNGDTSGAALALDGGVTVSARWLGVRAQAGYVRMFSDADADAFRFSLGGVYRF